mmetsp:Transcript_15442/g.27324  ORF Transcript_15442/g.27324 Transcript_15442/m.27324 type:complete len:377 (+) Transcript_15442:63-1193(+)
MVHVAVGEGDLQQAHRVQLDAAPPKLALHLPVALVQPAAALTAGGQDGGVMAHLLAEVAQPLFWRDELKRLAQQRVERLAGAAHGGGVTAGSKGSHVRQPFDAARAALGGRIQQRAVLHILRPLLQRADRLVEKDGQADAGEVLADAVTDDRPKADTLLRLARWRQAGAPLRLAETREKVGRPGNVVHAVTPRQVTRRNELRVAGVDGGAPRFGDARQRKSRRATHRAAILARPRTALRRVAVVKHKVLLVGAVMIHRFRIVAARFALLLPISARAAAARRLLVGAHHDGRLKKPLVVLHLRHIIHQLPPLLDLLAQHVAHQHMLLPKHLFHKLDQLHFNAAHLQLLHQLPRHRLEAAGGGIDGGHGGCVGAECLG